jgi:phenylpropionate dioxygenase-like ring-hydroxylating dioxygenase large terminal subunit
LEASSIPPAFYTDVDHHRWEDDVIFQRGWVGVGRSDRWAKPRTVIPVEIGRSSAIVVRNESGELRAFANACRHRGTELVAAAEVCSRIRCPFHAWTYDLDGRLVGAPQMHLTVDFDRGEYGLVPFAIAERAGFVFVSVAPNPPSFDEWFAGFDEIHVPWNVGELVITRRREFSVACNWKAFAEVFNEYYHLPYVHPGSIDNSYHEPDTPEEVSGALATQFGQTTGTAGLLDTHANDALPLIEGLADRAPGVRYTWLFPNIVAAFGVECMWMYEVYPDGPGSCRCAQVICFPESTTELEDFDEKAKSYYERFDVAIGEDIPVLERQQRGLSSAAALPGRFSRLEPSVARFARWYADRMLADR